MLRDPLAATIAPKLTGAKLAESRDQRMNESVQATQYDLILIKHCVKIARLKRGVQLPDNPFDSVRIPNDIKRWDRLLRHGQY